MTQDATSTVLEQPEDSSPIKAADQPQETGSPDTPASSSTPAASSIDGLTAPDYLSLVFRDGLDMPIDGLTFIATFPNGEMCTAESTAAGAIAVPLPAKATGEVKLEVKDETGDKQTVCTIDLSKCGGTVVVRSPKTKVSTSLQPHQQTAPAKSPAPKEPKPKEPPQKPALEGKQPKQVDATSSWWGANGAWSKAWNWITGEHHFFGNAQAAPSPKRSEAAKGLSTGGQPVIAAMGPEVADKDNLRLGRNNIYRQAILDASKRLGLIPQALCALMDCEAGKITEKLPVLNADGSPAKDKKGKPLFKKVTERWNANAGNAQSGASGLTQFLASTWLQHVMTPSLYIHSKSVANGWVLQEPNAKGKKLWVFVLADGSTTNTPYKKRGTDENVKQCLAMRMDPTWSINAAADYGCSNLKVLESKGFKLSGLNDMEKAKLMYLMHHEGEGCGPLFIRNKLADRKDGVGGVERLKQVFAMQLGTNGVALAKELIDAADGDVEKAYRRWLAKYIDSNFHMSTKYFFKNPPEIDELSVLMDSIGGESL